MTIRGQMTGVLDVVTLASSTDAATGNCDQTSTTSNIVVNGDLTYP